MRCRSCRSEVPTGARFCPACGVGVASAGTREVRKTVTVLFCDMMDSTALSERLDPEVVSDMMGRYFTSMRDCLVRRGGTVEKFIGDAVMAVFGVPTVSEDDPLRAVLAAVDMQAGIKELNRQLADIGDIRLGIRIGINTGEVVTSEGPAGNQALAAGSTVNLAARLQQQAGRGEVLLGPQTYKAASGAVTTEPVGPIRLKGISDLVMAHRLVHIDPGSPALARRQDVPLVNRDDELRELEFALDRSIRDNSCHVITVYGDAGLGKSRLATEFESLARSRGGLAATGRCRAHGEGPSLLPLAEALRRLMAAPASDSVLSDPGAAQAIATLLRTGAPGPLVADMAWAVCQLLEVLGRNRPVLVVLDDLHWADRALLDVIGQVAGQIEDAMVILLCLARTDLISQWPGWGGLPNARSQVLRPLTSQDCLTLITELSEVAAHDATVAETIVERAEGNPLFAEQLAAIVADGAAPGTLPASVSLLVAARLDLLSEAERGVLCAASVIGREFAADALLGVSAELTGPSGHAALEEALAGLSRRRLIKRSHPAVPGHASFRFVSTAVCQVAYESLPKRVRARLHAYLADQLEEQGMAGGEPADRLLAEESIGTHLESAYRCLEDLGPVDDAAVDLARRAALRLAAVGAGAMRCGDLTRAAGLLDRAFRLSRPGDPQRTVCLEQLAEAYIAVGQVEAGLRLMTQALGEAEGAGDVLTAAHARLFLAYLERSGIQFAASLSAATQALPVFEAHHDELGLARAWARIGQARQSEGRFSDAEETLDRALAHALAADAELERATVLGALALSLWLGPRPAADAIDKCRALMAEHAGAGRAARVALGCPLAVLLAEAGDIGQARELTTVAQQTADEIGHAYAMATVPIFAAVVEECADRWERAAHLLREAERRCLKLGDTQLRATASTELARVLLWQGRQAEALAAATAVSGSVSRAVPVTAAGLRGVTAQVLAFRGQHTAARRHADEALAEAGQTDSPSCLGTALLDSAWVLAAAGRTDAARLAAERAWHAFARKGHVAGQRWSAALLTRRLR